MPELMRVVPRRYRRLAAWFYRGEHHLAFGRRTVDDVAFSAARSGSIVKTVSGQQFYVWRGHVYIPPSQPEPDALVMLAAQPGIVSIPALITEPETPAAELAEAR